MEKKKTAYYITQEAESKAKELEKLLSAMGDEFGNYSWLGSHINYNSLGKAVMDLVISFTPHGHHTPGATEVTHETLENFGYTDQQISILVNEGYLETIEPLFSKVSRFEELKEHLVNLGPEILNYDEFFTLLNAVREEALTNLTDNEEPLVAGDFRDQELYDLLGWVITNLRELSKLSHLYQILKKV